MYEVGLSKNVVAWHVMPGMEGPEGELHQHEYKLDVVVTRRQLDDAGMVCDLDHLDAVLERVTAIVADKNLEIIQPEDAPAVTVEVFARWVHAEVAAELPTDVELSVRVWESPVAFGGYAAPTRSS